MFFQQILTLEHRHVLQWLSETPCMAERRRQIFATDIKALARYFRLLEKTYLDFIFHELSAEDICGLFYRFSLAEAAQIIHHLLPQQGQRILKLLDAVTRKAICSEMDQIRATFLTGFRRIG
ncbi:hypothetical protein B4907_13820 [Yersinia kristensenii]|nr:hypothetical protein B4907_13820 [Yersinia kristensenii]